MNSPNPRQPRTRNLAPFVHLRSPSLGRFWNQSGTTGGVSLHDFKVSGELATSGVPFTALILAGIPPCRLDLRSPPQFWRRFGDAAECLSVVRRDETFQFFEPVLYEDELRRGSLPAFLDHQEALAIRGDVVGACECTPKLACLEDNLGVWHGPWRGFQLRDQVRRERLLRYRVHLLPRINMKNQGPLACRGDISLTLNAQQGRDVRESFDIVDTSLPNPRSNSSMV